MHLLILSSLFFPYFGKIEVFSDDFETTIGASPSYPTAGVKIRRTDIHIADIGDPIIGNLGEGPEPVLL